MVAGVFRRVSALTSLILQKMFVLYMLATLVFLYYMVKNEAYKEVCRGLILQQQQLMNIPQKNIPLSGSVPVPVPVQVAMPMPVEALVPVIPIQAPAPVKVQVPAPVPVPVSLAMQPFPAKALVPVPVPMPAQVPRQDGCDGDFNLIKGLFPRDERTLRYIRCKHLFPPSTLPYDVDFRSANSDLDPILEHIFKQITNGYFIELGAQDGQFQSKTLSLEIFNGWTGLLIESNPAMFLNLKQRNRKVWIGDMCVSPGAEISQDDILKRPSSDQTGTGQGQVQPGKLLLPDELNLQLRGHFEGIGLLECFPLSSITTALNVSHVNFLSLSAQGAELKILNHLPYDRSLQIDIILLEFALVPEGRIAIRNFMESRNYFAIFESRTHLIYALKLQ